MIRIKVLLSQAYFNLADIFLSCLTLCFICSRRLLIYLAFQCFVYEPTWWRLFQKHCPLHNKVDIYLLFLLLIMLQNSYEVENIKPTEVVSWLLPDICCFTLPSCFVFIPDLVVLWRSGSVWRLDKKKNCLNQRQSQTFLRVLRFPPPIKPTATI